MIAGHKLAAEARGYVDGPHAGFLPRRLALFSPVTRTGGARQQCRSIFIQIRARCVLPLAGTARQGVEPSPMHSRLRSAASHPTRVPVVIRLDARSGRVLSDRKRSALPVNSTERA